MSSIVSRYRERVTPNQGSSVFPIGYRDDTNLKTGVVSNHVVVTAQLNAEWIASAAQWDRSWDYSHGRPPYRRGDPFLCSSFTTPCDVKGSGNYTIGTVGTGNSAARRVYHGGFTSPAARSTSPYLEAMSSAFTATTFGDGGYNDTFNPNDLDALGDKAYKALRPKVEIASLAQAVAEIGEAPQMAKQSARGFVDTYRLLGGQARGSVMKFVGSTKKPLEGLAAEEHFLNHAFGWVPFVKDVTEMADLCLSYDHYVARAKRHNNKWRKRVFSEPVDSTEEVISDEDLWGIKPAPFTTTLAGFKKRYRIIKRTSKHVWYEGSFRTYNPEFDDSVPMNPALRQARQALTLAGASVNPVVLYKITPWTWLADWFTNTGDLVQRAQDALTDSNVARYVYVMRTVVVEYLYQQNFTTVDGQTQTLEWSFGGVVKLRAKGSSPFEFRLRTGGLTPFQGAILGALGLSHLHP